MNNIPVTKNNEYIVDIVDNGYQAEGIAKIDNFTIFIPNAIKGEKVKIVITKVLTSHAFGKIIEIIKKSDYREEVDCLTYKRCGGCNLRHITYAQTLEIKKSMVQNLIDKNLNQNIEIKNIIGMENPYHYRNKAQFPIGIDKNGNNVVGIFANRSHEIIQFNNCFIHSKQAKEIANFVVEFLNDNNITSYNEETKKGIFRHIIIRNGYRTKDIMCIFVINSKSFPKEKELVNLLIDRFDNIKSIVKNINLKNTNVILGDEFINLYGDGYIYDKLAEYTFKISPKSFYQTNPIQIEKLYNLAVQGIDLNKKQQIAFDLYCGIGTITIFISKYFKKVYGIEIVEEAIKDAKQNAIINNINNIDFIAGDVEVELDNLINRENISPDVVFLDPPRKGLDNKTIDNILKIKPNKLIYISCNPATLVRDLKKLEEVYNINSIELVDMFPFTSHVECVAVLHLKQDM